MKIQSLRADESIDVIIERYTPTVYGIAMSRLGNSIAADEVFTDVFFTLYKKNPQINDEEHLKAWLIRTTLNICKRVSARSVSSRIFPLDAAKNKAVNFTFATKDENSVYQALSSLPEKYRTILHLFYFEEMSGAEIAHALGMREGAVRTCLSRGREMMRDKLKGEFSDEI